ncbi:MAG: signal peptidase I, partial [Spirochaetales bacterium]|nr:signal peptidase I [Spirochaetales bacterium]
VNRESIPWYITVLDPVVRFFTLQKKTLLSGNNKPWNNQIAVKRIIGLPGDEIKLVNYHFYIKPEGEKEFIPEEQITDKKYEIIFPVKSVNDTSTVPFFGNMEELMLTENNYFVANDNRQMQYDSRLYGPVSRDLIIGEVFLSYFPGFSLK